MASHRIRQLVIGLAALGLLLVGTAAPAQASNQDPAGVCYNNDVCRHTAWNGGALALQNSDGREEYFWIGSSNGAESSSGTVWHEWEVSVGSHTLSAPQSLGHTGTYGLGGARNADGRLEIFTRGTNGQLYHVYQQAAGGWSDWHSLGGALAADTGYPKPYILSDGRLAVDVWGTDHQAHRTYQLKDGSGWSGWVWPSDGN